MSLVSTDIVRGQQWAGVARSFGGKAAGFTVIPAAWRPPAIFIGDALYNSYLEGDQPFTDAIVQTWKATSAFAMELGHALLIRSSATDESITERGQFKSIKIDYNVTADKFRTVVTEIFDHYKQHGRQSMCLIAQCYIDAIETGFLSNELRLVDKPYRWIVERYLLSTTESVPPISLSAKQARAISEAEPLVCLSRQELLSRLRSVARYFWKTGPSQRVLVEWCWDGSKLWIVQRDNANPGAKGRDPEELVSAVFRPPERETGGVFQRYSVGTSTPWQKLKNVTDFATGGKSPPHRLFYVVANAVSSALKTPEGASAVAVEIDELTAGRAVLRTDSLKRGFNLPRTHTVNGLEAVEWLRKQLILWSDRSVDENDIAFILHSYIPARAAAWSYYRRNSPVVRIDALWGLADGMQYYPTDTFICRADNGELISETLRYKELVLLEQPDGRWITDRVAPRFARYRVLSKFERSDIAMRTRGISDNLNSDVQIMWFTDIPSEFKLEHNLPWFKVTPEQDVEERKSKPLVSITVRGRDDLERLKAVAPGSMKVILEPSGEDLRSDEFIEAVSNVCISLNLPVEIRGSILSHAFHQLARAGVQVYSAEPGKQSVEMRQRKAFDKLVRDQVPESIKAKGEAVSADELAPEELALALIGKLFEEAEEFVDANSNDARREELADLFEIVRALSEVSNLDFADIVERADFKRMRRGGFAKGVILRSTSLTADAPRAPELFDESAGRRRISLNSLKESHSGTRSQMPVSTLLSKGPRVVLLNLPGDLDVKIKIELSGGVIAVEFLEAHDRKRDEQKSLI